MAFVEEPTTEGAEGVPLPGEGQNRTFIILAAALGGIFVIGLLCIGVYALFIGPNQRKAQQTQAAAIVATNAEIAMQMTQASLPTDTPLPSATPLPSDTPLPLPATDTPLPKPTDTPTAIQVAAVTDTPTPLGAAVTVTGTVRPGGSATPTPLVGGLRPTATRTPSPTQLPGTGFADEAGVPGLVGLSLALIVVVILARRLRLSLG